MLIENTFKTDTESCETCMKHEKGKDDKKPVFVIPYIKNFPI